MMQECMDSCQGVHQHNGEDGPGKRTDRNAEHSAGGQGYAHQHGKHRAGGSAAGNAQHIWLCQRIFGKGLHTDAGKGQAASHHHAQQRPGNADAPHNVQGAELDVVNAEQAEQIVKNDAPDGGKGDFRCAQGNAGNHGKHQHSRQHHAAQKGVPAQTVAEFFQHCRLLEALRMEILRKLLDGVGGHGAGEHFAQGDGIDAVVGNGGNGCQGGVALELLNLVFQRGGAVVIDDDNIGVGIHHGFPGHHGPGLFHVLEYVHAAGMTNQLGGEVVAAGIGTVVHEGVEHEDLYGFGILDGFLHIGNLLLHAVHNLVRLVLHIEDTTQVLEVGVNIFHVSAQLVALDGGQGCNAVAGELIVGGAVLLAESRAAPVNKVRLCLHQLLQGGCFLGNHGSGIVHFLIFRVDGGVLVAHADDFILQAHGIQLVGGVGVGGNYTLGHMVEGHGHVHVGRQGEGELRFLCADAEHGDGQQHRCCQHQGKYFFHWENPSFLIFQHE